MILYFVLFEEPESAFNKGKALNLNIDGTIQAYQARGHLIADIDPLGLQHSEVLKLQGTPTPAPAVVVRRHLEGITEADLDREYPLGSLVMIGGSKSSLTLREILTRLNKVYCGHLGLEYTYIPNFEVIKKEDKNSTSRKSFIPSYQEAVSLLVVGRV